MREEERGHGVCERAKEATSMSNDAILEIYDYTPACEYTSPKGDKPVESYASGD